MAFESIDGNGSGSDHEGPIEVAHNPNGPWANMENKKQQDAIAREAGKYHTQCALENPRLSRFEDFLDALTVAWLEQKSKVEDEAEKYGFTECEDTALLSDEDRRKSALLTLTLNGSYILLGNGCLTAGGGSGRYERIPFRKEDVAEKYNASNSVSVDGDAKLHEPLRFVKKLILFITKSSNLQMLFTTTQNLSEEDQLRLGEALEESYAGLVATIQGGVEETNEVKPSPLRPDRDDEFPGVVPPEVPEYEPVN